MRILAFNSGSSSIKCAVIDTSTGARAFEARVQDIGSTNARLSVGSVTSDLSGPLDPAVAIDALLAKLRSCRVDLGKIDAIVHRVVHGGDGFTAPTAVDERVLEALSSLEGLAPLHNPSAILALRGARKLFADIPHVLVFDTAFHATLPSHAREYALPADVRTRFKIRRYGFHGISHGDVAIRVARHLRSTPQQLRVISCHLGSGASITAIESGRSVETSMGMTPLEGLVMSTRAGDLDPGILLELGRSLSPAELSQLLNQGSGLAGLTGTGDLRTIENRANEGDENCRLAISLYIHRIRKYIGAYAAVMGGVDVIAFTGGVGEHSSLVRHRCLQSMEFLGAVIDEVANRNARLDDVSPLLDIGREDSRVRILLLRADEERAMAADAAELLEACGQPATPTPAEDLHRGKKNSHE